MSKKVFNLLDFGIEEEIDPTLKLNSLLSVTVSTIMCIAARCPLPQSNVETTKKFLSSITDDDYKTPRNIKGFLSLLNDYTGPYEGSGNRGTKDKEKSARDTLYPDREHKSSLENLSLNRNVAMVKDGASTDCQVVSKGSTRAKKTEKSSRRKTGRSPASKPSSSKSTIVGKS